jgi:serine/threonine-protein kinase
VAITAKAFDILAALVQSSDHVVEKDDLMHRVWPDAIVEEANLSQQIFLLRKLLGEGPKDHRYIATVPRRGYRFVAAVTEVSVGPSAAPNPITPLFPLPPTAPSLLGGHPLHLWLAIGADAPLALGACAPFTLSPDGRLLAYVAWAGDTTTLYLRRLDHSRGVRIAETDGAYSPFFSPDSRWIGFFAGGRLKKILAAGGAPLTVCDAGHECRGASWGLRNDIVFAPTPASGLTVVSADDGSPRPATTLDFGKGERTHRWPHWLPNGRDLLFTVARAGSASFDDADIGVASIESGVRQVLLRHGTCARYVPTGHLVYMRGGSMMAVPFDPDRRGLIGQTVPVLEHVMTQPTGAGHVAFARTGSLIYLTGEAQKVQRHLVRIDASGQVHPVALPERAIEEPRLSPDGRKLAIGVRETTNDIWVYDFTRSGLTRVTFEADNFAAIWTPDGTRLTFSSNRTGPCQIYWRAADGNGPDERIVGGDHDLVPGSWSQDGDTLSFTEYHPETGASIWMCSPRTGTPPRPLVRASFNQYGPAFSPDAHWLAYTSDESGRAEVYVVSFPDLTRKEQISLDGGAEPIWARDATHLYYRSGSRILRVEIDSGHDTVFGSPHTVGDGPYLSGAVTGLPNYDVTSDGDFLMIAQEAAQTRPDQLSVIVNWFTDLTSRFASA